MEPKVTLFSATGIVFLGCTLGWIILQTESLRAISRKRVRVFRRSDNGYIKLRSPFKNNAFERSNERVFDPTLGYEPYWAEIPKNPTTVNLDCEYSFCVRRLRKLEPLCGVARRNSQKRNFSSYCELLITSCNEPAEGWRFVYDGNCVDIKTYEPKGKVERASSYAYPWRASFPATPPAYNQYNDYRYNNYGKRK